MLALRPVGEWPVDSALSTGHSDQDEVDVTEWLVDSTLSSSTTSIKSDNNLINNLKALKKTTTDKKLPELGFVELVIVDLTVNFSFNRSQMSLPEIQSPGIYRCVLPAHLPRTRCSHTQLLQRLVFDFHSMHLHGPSNETLCLRFAQEHSHLIAQCRTLCHT